jgi:L-asparagine transporter-like permease
VWLALTLVITSYMGIEGIAVTAGEAQHPETSIPRAMRTMVLRLILFYVLAIAVMLMMSPWRELAEGGGGITGSPFVRAFAAIGIPYAAGAMNLVVISAAVSSANSNLYMTRGCCCRWRDPGMRHAAGVVSRRRAAAASPAPAPASARRSCWRCTRRRMLSSRSTAPPCAGMLFIWIVILFTYPALSGRRCTPDQLARLPIRMRAHRLAAVVRHRLLTRSQRPRSSSTACDTACVSCRSSLVMSIVYSAPKQSAHA